MPVTTLPLALDLTVYAGTTFSRDFVWKPDGVTGQDFTGWSGLLLIGASRGPAEQEHPVTLTSTGQLTVTLSVADTAALSAANLIYQVDLTDPTGAVMRFLRGRVTVVYDLARKPT